MSLKGVCLTFLLLCREKFILEQEIMLKEDAIRHQNGEVLVRLSQKEVMRELKTSVLGQMLYIMY